MDIKNKETFWKNIIIFGILSIILLGVFVYNLKIGFSIHDWSDATISNMFILNAFIVLFSVPLVVLVLFFYKKKRKNRKK